MYSNIIMNQKNLKEYILFAVVTILVGLLVCNIICEYKPEMIEYNKNNNKYMYITVFGITGLFLRYAISTKMGEKYLFSDNADKLKIEIAKVRKERNNEIKAPVVSQTSAVEQVPPTVSV